MPCEYAKLDFNMGRYLCSLTGDVCGLAMPDLGRCKRGKVLKKNMSNSLRASVVCQLDKLDRVGDKKIPVPEISEEIEEAVFGDLN